MGAPEQAPLERRRTGLRRLGIAVIVILLAGLVVFALSRLNLHRVGHALVTASPGWIALALVLMALSLVLRSVSWYATLRAALPDTPIRLGAVVRATMIGVMGSAVFPGRIGEPSRVLVLTRRLEGPNRRLLPVVAGTVFSQTLINLLALGVLLAVTFSSVRIFHGNVAGIEAALAVPLAISALVIAGPRLLALARRSRSMRVSGAADAITRLLQLARRGLIVFARPRYGLAAVSAQLLAWALQWLACYAVIRALSLQAHADLTAAAAILLAVNLSAILPATPSNVGVFQAACLVVLAAYGVGAGPALAYGIILQAVEVVTALALGVPALLREGLSWQDIRPKRSAGEGAQ
ncbi:MAG: phosphatidyl-myo-inositol alpha-mannosyltransferase [Solirubrobacteraceae bacterium]|jgi:phosphatidylinositol alpha-mannosyltransferase|nr:phosphatidyl-myo-inositol alpha-mannosyltransferase [Solirubrobacteraceae bacterium]